MVLILFLTVHAASAKEVVRLSTGEWRPYVSETEPNNGIMVQITKEAFAVKGIEVDLGFFPWGRATQSSKNGEWDGTIALVRLTEREPFYHFSEPLYVGHYAFFHLKSVDFKWKDYSDLKNTTIASTIGFGGMGEDFMQAEKKGTIKVLRLASDIQGFSMLMAKRADVVPSDVEVGYVLLKKLYGDKASLFTHDSDHYIVKSDYRLAISKKIKNGPDLVAKFNDGLAQLRKTGRYDEILRTWYGRPVYKDAVPADYLARPPGRGGVKSAKR